MGFDAVESKLSCGCTEIAIEYEIFIRKFIVPNKNCKIDMNKMRKDKLGDVYFKDDLSNDNNIRAKQIYKLIEKFKNQFDDYNKYRKYYKIVEGIDINEYMESMKGDE